MYAIVGQVVLTICMLCEGVTGLKPYLYSPIRSLVLGGNVGGNTPLWFIPSLLVVQIAAAWLLGEKKLPWLWAIVSIVLGYGLYLLDLPFVPTYIESAFGGLFFFCMGNWLKDWQYKWWMTVVCLVVVVCVLCFGICGFVVRDNGIGYGVGYGNYFVGALVSLAGCIAVNGIFKWLHPYLKFYGLQYVGRNAMTIYVTHWIVLLLSVRLIASDWLHIWNANWLLLIGGLSCLIVIPVYTEMLKYVKTK